MNRYFQRASTFVLGFVAAFLATTCAPKQSTSASPSTVAPRRIEVLFFGHTSTHHNSGLFAPMIKSALAGDGINFTYTVDQNDLNPTTLAQYDAVMMYGNNTRIAPEQEKALLDYVASGKGFLPIHAASYMFQNSPAYIALVGAQFQRHGTGVFSAQMTMPEHPILAGIQPFEAWDETYVHTKHNPDRTVIMERVDANGREPWTWVRTHGKGRVFYTASGHDERVWGHATFHKLLKNAILWAVGPEVKAQWDRLGIKPLTYSTGPVPVPNYERRDPPPQYQEPLTTGEAAKHMQIPPGFDLTLFAEEPMIVNPIAMAFDHRGRLFVIETVDYPSNKLPAGQGNDVIKILEDTNNDGRADKSTIFADKLSIATSLTMVDGGVMVSQAPDFIFFKDTNGDDKADIRETRITGWRINDTHAGPSNLKYGLDNMLWGSVGYAGFNGTIGGKPFNFSQGLYRFTADGKQLERMTNFSNNTWGLAFNEAFDVFGSTANNEHSVYMAIPNRFYAADGDTVRGLSRNGKKKIDGHYPMHANTQKIRQVDSQGGFTAAAGHNFYTARSFPREYWNRIAFVNEPTGHVVHRAIIERKGSGFAEVDGWNIMASDDEWMAPVHSEVGPDGALWVLDWYHFIIQHNPTPSGVVAQGFSFQTGQGAAYSTPLRDSRRGRIYRLSWSGAKPYTPVTLSPDRPRDLVQALRNDNMFWRTTAQRLLVERKNRDVLNDLYAIASDKTVDAVGLNAPAIHALWTIHGLGALDGSNAQALGVARQALSHPSAAVRKTALAVLPRQQASLDSILKSGRLMDADLNVRLGALLAIAEMPASKAAGRAVYDLSKRKEVIEDEWLPEAVFIAAKRHSEGFFAAYAEDIGVAAFTRLAVRAAKGGLETFMDWSAPGLAVDSTWRRIQVPAIWRDTPLGPHLGAIWFRRDIDVPATAVGKPATLRLGVVTNNEMTFINGSRVSNRVMPDAGAGGGRGGNPNAARVYSVPGGVLVPGRNVIAVRVTSTSTRGGIIPDTLGGVTLAGDGFSLPLAGQWRYKIEETWEGGRRREVAVTIPMAQQFLMHNSPISDMVRPDSVMMTVVAAPPAAATPPVTATPPGGAPPVAAGANPPAVAGANPPAGGAGAAPPAATGRGTGRGRGGPPPLLVVALSVVTGENKFNLSTISARPGQNIRLQFSNTDDMQHNVVVLQRNAFPAIERELTAMFTDPDAQSRGFIPESQMVLFNTPLVPARQSTVLEFQAPMEPGDYPFICTFPGHWLTMRGVLRVAQ